MLILAGAAAVYYFTPLFKPKAPGAIASFEECQAAGNLVVNTKPRECHTKDGTVFTEEYNGILLQEFIAVTTPVANQTISSPFKLEGKAVGAWYFNEQLYVKLYDGDGKIIATKEIKALSTTMTSDFVPFVAAISFPKTESIKGKLVIEKTNTTDTTTENGPLIIPVRFK